MNNNSAPRLDGASPKVTEDPISAFCSTVFSDLPHAAQFHLAVMREPYLGFIFRGTKTLESRFSIKKVKPFNAINQGDILLLKIPTGPIVGLCRVGRVTFHDLFDHDIEKIRRNYAHALCARDDEFWEQRRQCRYVTLIELERVKRTSPIECKKRDRRGWVVLSVKERGNWFRASLDYRVV